jgi:hypothetical protein
VPVYGTRQVVVGYRTETRREPNMVMQEVQVGSEWRWVLEEIPDEVVEDPQPDSTETPTPGPVQVSEVSTPEPEPPPLPETLSTNAQPPTSTPQPSMTIDGETLADVVRAPLCPLTQEQLETVQERERQQAMIHLAQLRRQEWLGIYRDEVNACLDENSEACLIHLGLAIYDHHAIDLGYYFDNRINNPIEDLDEFRMISDTVILGGRDPVSVLFLDTLGFDIYHHSNYEAAFLDALRRRYPFLYLDMFSNVREQDALRQYIDDEAWDDIIGPTYGGYPDAYIGDYPYLLEPFNLNE